LTQNNPKNQRYFSPTSVLAIRRFEIRGGSHHFLRGPQGFRGIPHAQTLLTEQ